MTRRIHWLTVHGAAQRLEVCAATIRRWIRAGKLPAVQYPNGRVRIPSEAVEKILTTIVDKC